MERIVLVKEFTSFDEAWLAASNTKSSFDYYQGMGFKISMIKKSERFFVDMDKKELWYSYMINPEGLRVLHKADPISSLSSGGFEYVQIMISIEELNPERTGKLRFSGEYVTRMDAAKISKQAEVFAFYKQ